MGSDLRTSARDLLALAQKVSTVLQRHSDKLLGEIEDSQDSLASEEEALRSEQCQEALEVRRQVWESSKLLQSALNHVEDIEDEDEPRILHDSIEALQVHVRKGLKNMSDAESKGREHSDTGAEETIASRLEASQSSSGMTAQKTVGQATSGPSSLLGSMNRHPLGLFSTSPKFTARSPFSSLPSPCFTPIKTAISSNESAAVETSPSSQALKPLKTPKAPVPIASRKQPVKSTVIALDEGPLSIPITPTGFAPEARTHSDQDSADTVSLASSVASSVATFSTALTTLPNVPASSPAKTNTASTPTIDFLSSKQTNAEEGMALKKPDPPLGPPQRRRVPRGLFSSTSTSGLDPVWASGLDHDEFDSNFIDHTMSQGFSEGSTAHGRTEYSDGGPSTLEAVDVETSGITSPQLSVYSSGGSPPQSSSSRPQSPHSSLTSTFSSPSACGTKSPELPSLQRSQPKPSPIQTTSLHSPLRANVDGAKSGALGGDGEEEISQLARDLERAMNPTPTEPVPQLYFLQGKGLLQRIPSHVSMDDGLLDEDDDDQQSEGLDTNDAQESQLDGSDMSHGNGYLRRRGSGSRRRFKISRSRSRNRSKGRQEGRSKQSLTPIEVGYPAALTSSEWPFDWSPPRGRSMVSSSSVQRQQNQALSSSSYSTLSQEWQSKAGPRLPFAESVTIENPNRVGKGIGSFTIYSISLKLCDPTKAILEPSYISGRRRGDIFMEEQSRGSSEQHAGHAPEDSNTTINTLHRNINNQHSEEGIETTDEDMSAEHHRAHLSRVPSKALIMMTGSFSVPELDSTVDRQMQDELFPRLSIESTSSAPCASSPHPRGSGSSANVATIPGDDDPSSTNTTERIIHVRKRYSDFVTLRAQLVDILKRSSRSGGRGRQPPLSQPASRSYAASSSAPGTVNGPPHSHGARNSEAFNDEEGIEDNDVATGSHSRTTTSGTSTASTAVLCRSILRGIPKLPPKKVVGKFRPAFVEKRRRELEYFLEWVVAHPVIGDCPVV
ncbi:hypothetical protein BGZ65_002455, partial [Modicella reniformis]